MNEKTFFRCFSGTFSFILSLENNKAHEVEMSIT